MCKQFFKMQGLQNKLAILWKGPGWQPGLPRLGSSEYPKIKYPVRVYHPNISQALSTYTFLHFLYILLQHSAILNYSIVNQILL